MPSVDEVRALVAPRWLKCQPGVTKPKNDVLFVQVKPQSDAGGWYVTLKYGADERAMTAEQYKAAVIDPAFAGI